MPAAAGVPLESWRVPRKVPVAKLAVAAVLLVLAFARADNPWLLGAAALVAAGFAGWGAWDLAVPVRLTADRSGVTVVTGLTRGHRLAWPEVASVRVDIRRRSKMLELDTGERIFLLSRYDVDADLDEVADRLARLRTADSG